MFDFYRPVQLEYLQTGGSLQSKPAIFLSCRKEGRTNICIYSICIVVKGRQSSENSPGTSPQHTIRYPYFNIKYHLKMLGRAGILVPLCGQQQQQARGMATLKAISIRLKSVKNIQKITQSMKMVSAAKYSKAERELKQARPYGEGAKQFYEKAEVAPVGEAPKKLVVAITSDRGLCGAVHTQVSRSIRTELTEDPENTKIICVGDKSRAILQRLYGKNIIGVANEVGRKPPTFTDAAKLTNIILNSGYEFTAGRIVYNRFKSVVSYTTTDLPLFSLEAIQAAPKLPVYDSLDSEVLQSYLEYSIASLIFYAMKEGACSEQSSRMTAMDNASKNAGEMIDKLTLTFNRTRQAVITRELIEIISGAAALD